jgi:hypothetical protein
MAVQIKRGTAAQWASLNPVLADGEPGVERDTGRIKVGNGVSFWSSLPYTGGGAPLYRGAWAATTAYQKGQIVAAPDGSLQAAISDFTSGSSFVQSNWTRFSGNGVRTWAASTVYGLGDLVVNLGITYYVNTAHTSASAFSTNASKFTALPTTAIPADWTLPTGILRQNMPRYVAMSNALGAPTSGQLTLYAIYLFAGDVVNSIAFTSGATGLSTGSNQWFSLWSASRAQLGVTSDDTSTAWATGTRKSLNLTTPYTVTSSGLYYAGMVVVATTVPSLTGISSTFPSITQAPILGGTADSGLTNPASAPSTAASLTALGKLAWVQVS